MKKRADLLVKGILCVMLLQSTEEPHPVLRMKNELPPADVPAGCRAMSGPGPSLCGDFDLILGNKRLLKRKMLCDRH
jgi:hypothetical protein